MIVECPTVTPATSVMALAAPGVPSNGTPRSRARGARWVNAGGDGTRTAAATMAATMTRGWAYDMRASLPHAPGGCREAAVQDDGGPGGPPPCRRPRVSGGYGLRVARSVDGGTRPLPRM